MFIDLHMHSTASDGTDAPAELARIAAELGLSAIALTDHDTTAGLSECAAACEREGITFVPGIELSCERGQERGTLHMLGYFVDPASEPLQRIAAEQIEARDTRNPQIIERLNRLGVDITLEDVRQQAGDGVIGRPHIAAVLMSRGYAKSMQDAFNRYIGYGAPAYVRKDRLPAGRAIDAVHAAGGLAVLAHPVQLKAADAADLQQVITDLIKLGLDGIEVWHSDHTPADVEQFRRLAERFELLMTGGSDYHGRRKDVAMGSQRVPGSVLEELTAAHERHQHAPGKPGG